MVTTRSQYRKSVSAQQGQSRRSSSSSASSNTKASRSPGKAVIDADAETPARKPRSQVSQLLDVPGTVPGEHLGRGHRQHREIITLDEQYLSQSMHRPHSAGNSKRDSGHALGTSPDQLVIHHRYPERDAAKRAMSNLQDTLHEMARTGTTSSSDSSDEDDDDSSSSSSSSSTPEALLDGDFHFRNHPEMTSRTARRNRSDSDDESPPHRDRRYSHRNGGNASAADTRRGRTSGTSVDSGLAQRSTGTLVGQKRARSSDSVTEASISDDSVREESIANLAQADAKLARVEDGSDDGVSEEDEVVTQSELRRASRNAKESVDKNININYYMNDAIGAQAPESKQRRRELDRRYRHLFEAAHNDGSGGVGEGETATAAGALGDLSPLHVDDDVSFDSVGGLPEHIVTLREMVLLPLLYPDLLRQLNLRPPRGVLFVGPPGTGKTLMARALANEGSRFSGQKITFFMRKGADILSKWVGESERQLKLLFEEAKRLQPSIIFFDEIDGLAPTRHTKTEQTQAALVATLLALLDGMEDRGQVVIIGATNRPDTLDPALRRPGRFDRELLFPPPDAAARRHILHILTQPLLPVGHPQREDILTSLVAHTEGYSGADLKALCTEAGLNRLRTAFPQLYTTSKRLRLPPSASSIRADGTDSQTRGLLDVRREDFFSAVQRVQPSLRRGGAEVRSLASLEEHQEVLYRGLRDAVLQRVADVWPTAARALRREQRDCSSLVAAVRELSSFPLPFPRGPLLLFLTSEVACRGGVAAAARSHGAAPVPKASAAIAQATLLHASLSLLKGLPSFQPLVVHLPHIQVSFLELPFGGNGGGAGGSAALFSDVFASGHMYELVQVIQRSAPCAVVLRGAAEWLQMHGLPPGATRASGTEADDSDVVGDDPQHYSGAYDSETYDRRENNMRALHYYLNLLAETEVLLIVPCEDPQTRTALLGLPSLPTSSPPSSVPSSAQKSRSRSSKETSLTSSPGKANSVASKPTAPTASVPPVCHLRFTQLDVCVPVHPSVHDVQQFVRHLYHVVSLSLAVALRLNQAIPTAEAVATAEEDMSPVSAHPVSKAQQQAAQQRDIALWRRVEYRRLQLRHVLLKWVSQYVSSGKYKLLLSPDLDLTPHHELYKAWQRHTKGRRIGLQDVVEKLENESYTCLSQYHDDIDLIARNVRTFFVSRSAQDQRYRLKALELKETTVLGLYRINRGVVRFCEAHKDLREPDISLLANTAEPADGRGENQHGDGAARGHPPHADLLVFAQRPAVTHRKKRPIRYFGQRRRRPRRPAVQPIALPSVATHAEESGSESEKDVAGSRDTDDGEVDRSRESSAQPSPFSPTQAPAEALTQWATERLRAVPFHVLLEVFRAVMIALEVQTQALQAASLSPSTARVVDKTDTNSSTPVRASRTSVGPEEAATATLSTFTPLAPPPLYGRCGEHTNDLHGEETPHHESASPAAHDPRQTRDSPALAPRESATPKASFVASAEQSEEVFITAFFKQSLNAAVESCYTRAAAAQ